MYIYIYNKYIYIYFGFGLGYRYRQNGNKLVYISQHAKAFQQKAVPSRDKRKRRGALIFVVQQAKASRLHILTRS